MLKYLFAILLSVTALQAQLIDPTAENVALAAKIGTQNKESSRVEGNYMIARKQNMEVVLKTPIFVAAKHGKSQAQEYLEADKDFLKYLESLKFVRIECMIMGFGGVVDPNLQGGLKVILLRDGIRVTNITSIPSYQGKNPFNMAKPNPVVRNQMAIIEKQAAATTQMLLAQLTQEQKEQYIRTQFQVGKSAKEIAKTIGWKEEDVLKLKPVEEIKAEISFTQDDGVYSLEELQKPGKYEAVVRQEAFGFDSPLFGSKDSAREYRITLKLDADAKLLKLLKK